MQFFTLSNKFDIYDEKNVLYNIQNKKLKFI